MASLARASPEPLPASWTRRSWRGYARGGSEDERYGELRDALVAAAREGGVARLDVVRPQENGALVLFSTGEADTEGTASLGDVRPLEGSLAGALDDMRAGGTVDPVTWQDGELGWRMMTAAPVYRTDGTACAYVVAELDMEPAVQAQRDFLLGTGVLLAVLAAVADRGVHAGDPAQLHSAHPASDQGGPGL